MRRYPANGPRYPAPTTDHCLVAVDLGKTKVGVAIFFEGALLTAFTSHSARGSSPRQVATEVRHRVWHQAGIDCVWVCEWPMKYDSDRVKHKDIAILQEVGHAFGDWDEKYLPGQWKGNVPKKPHHKRILRVLSDEELGNMADGNHDTIDAIGIGLFALGRTKRGGVL